MVQSAAEVAMSIKTRIFGTDDMRRAADVIGLDAMMDQMIERLQVAFEVFDPSSTEVPPRGGFHYESPQTGLIEWMPVMAKGEHALLKLVCYHPTNPVQSGLPTILSSFALVDAATGHMIAISDGTFLTALRTGAASAVATRSLATAGDGAVGMIGCGAQAITQLHAISRVCPIELVLFWDADCVARQSFPERMSCWLPEGTRLVETPVELIVPNVDVLCTATSIAVGQGPLFAHSMTRNAIHVNAVGSDFPGKIEIPRELLQASVVIPDFAAQARAEGECQQLDEAQVGPELYEVIQGEGTDALRGVRTVFDSTGWALEDLIAMEALVDWSEELGLGSEIQLESIPPDPKNPYALADMTDGLATRAAHRQGRS
jgi:ornithine cyclodeaminase/alanine dehydrogenase-like protein (mu-crystallin family)